MLDDRVCPACQVLLPDGVHTCVKCGRKVEPEDTGLHFIDVTRKVYPHLVRCLGTFWGRVLATMVFLALLILFIAFAVIRSFPSR